MRNLKRYFLAVAAMLATTLSMAQNGFNYQAVIRDAQGDLIADQNITLRISLISGTTTLYQERQAATTNAYGVVSVVVGTGTPLSGSFASIDWTKGNISMKTEFDPNGGTNFVVIGTTQLQAVPFAEYAKKTSAVENPNKIQITADDSAGDDDELFSVKDHDGNVVFAVYKSGVRVYVDDTDNGNKAAKSGFAVTGRSAKDGEASTYFAVNDEGTKVYVDGDDDTGKAAKAKFAVTSVKKGKATTEDNVFVINEEGTKVFIDDESAGKAAKAKFAVTSVKKGKEGESLADNYLVVNDEGTKVFVDGENSDKAAKAKFAVTSVRNGKAEEADDFFLIDNGGTQVFIDDEAHGKAAKAKFAVTSVKKGKDGEKADGVNPNYLLIDSDSTRVYIDDDEGKAAKSGFAVAGRSANKSGNSDILKVTKDSTRVYVDGGGAKSGFGVEGKGGSGKSGFAVSEKGANGNAGYMNVTAENFFAGYNAGQGNTEGINNVAIGNKAGITNTKGSNNLFFGNYAGYNTNGNGIERYYYSTDNETIIDTATAGWGNLFFGTRSGYNNVNGGDNIFMGHKSGYSNTNGRANLFLGRKAGYNTTTGDRNIFMGFHAGLSNTTGTANVAIGEQAARSLTTGAGNVALGTWTAYKFAEGDGNVFLGSAAGQYFIRGQDNVFIGYLAGPSDGYGSGISRNIAIGEFAGLYLDGVSNAKNEDNIMIGTSSSVTGTGNKNIIIGNSSYTNHNGCILIGNDLGNRYHDNYLAIGNYIYGTPDIRDGLGQGLEINGSILVGGVLWLEDGYLGDLFPSSIAEAGGITLTHNLGTLTKPWGTVYAKSLDISGTAAISGNTSVSGTLTTSGNATFKGTLTSGTIYPYTSSSSIGSARNRWNTIFTTDLNVSGSVTKTLKPSGTSIDLGSSDSRWGIIYGSALNVSSSSYQFPIVGDNTYVSSSYVAGVHGASSGGTGTNMGVFGKANSSSSTAHNHGVSGEAYGGTIAIGVYGYAANGTSNYAGWFGGDVMSTTGVYAHSDSRLKKNVETIDGALDKVLKLRGVTYYWKNREEMAAAKGVSVDNLLYGYDSKKHIGVIAQEIEKVFPEVVNTDPEGFKSVNYSDLAPVLIEAVKELKAEKDELQTTVTTQQAKIDNQQQQIDELKRLVEELMKKQ